MIDWLKWYFSVKWRIECSGKLHRRLIFKTTAWWRRKKCCWRSMATTKLSMVRVLRVWISVFLFLFYLYGCWPERGLGLPGPRRMDDIRRPGFQFALLLPGWDVKCGLKNMYKEQFNKQRTIIKTPTPKMGNKT